MTENIVVKFHTNLDPKIHWVFPSKVSCRPMIGDYVETNERPLKVCMITHCYDTLTSQPYLKVELTGTPRE